MSIAEFGQQHVGLCVIIRRHLQSRKLDAEVLRMLGVDENAALALRLGRKFNDGWQGLSSTGTANARRQGNALATLGIIPGAILHGNDQRNLDGALATAEGLSAGGQNHVLCYGSPGLTYPYYGELGVVRALFAEHGDHIVHRHLSRRFDETRSLWTEPVRALEARLMGAVEAIRNGESGFGLELWDLNFEQMILLYQRLIVGAPLSEIVYEEKGDVRPYETNYGAGIVIAGDGTIAEFTSEFEIGPSKK